MFSFKTSLCEPARASRYHEISHVESQEQNNLTNKTEAEARARGQPGRCQSGEGGHWVREGAGMGHRVCVPDPRTTVCGQQRGGGGAGGGEQTGDLGTSAIVSTRKTKLKSRHDVLK